MVATEMPMARTRHPSAIRLPLATRSPRARTPAPITADPARSSCSKQHASRLPVRCRSQRGSIARGNAIQRYDAMRTPGAASTTGSLIPMANPAEACPAITTSATPRRRGSGMMRPARHSCSMRLDSTARKPTTRMGASAHAATIRGDLTCGRVHHSARCSRPASHAPNAAHTGAIRPRVTVPAALSAME